MYSRLFCAKFIPWVLLFACQTQAQTPVITTTNLTIRLMAANITSGNYSSYEAPGIRIFQGLKPDIVAIQEFKYNNSTSDASLRALVDTAFGPSFYYYREPYLAGADIPNGIVSRWPIISSGSWDDPVLSNRGFAWALIDLPGTNDLYVVSVHLYSSGTATDRNNEAVAIKNNVATNFPANCWVVVGGDFNTDTRTEAAVGTFKTFLSDNPIPTDQQGNSNTSGPRTKPYDYLLPSFSFTNKLVPLTVSNHVFASGLVFDSRVFTNITEVPPVFTTDSDASQMQHMAVMKAIQVSWAVTNYVTNPPSITVQPQSLTVTQGQDATFAVTAQGDAPLTYTWRFGATVVAAGTASSYTRSNAQPTHAGSYSVTVSNSSGSVPSSNALLTVLVPPAISSQPEGLTVIAGSNVTFSVTATGTDPLRYQWQRANTNLPLATNADLNLPDVALHQSGVYRVIVTNEAGSMTSSNAVLVVYPTASATLAPAFLSPTQFQLSITGVPGFPYRVEASSNLFRWDALVTNLSPFLIVETNYDAFPRRFYRAIWEP